MKLFHLNVYVNGNLINDRLCVRINRPISKRNLCIYYGALLIPKISDNLTPPPPRRTTLRRENQSTIIYIATIKYIFILNTIHNIFVDIFNLFLYYLFIDSHKIRHWFHYYKYLLLLFMFLQIIDVLKTKTYCFG